MTIRAFTNALVFLALAGCDSVATPDAEDAKKGSSAHLSAVLATIDDKALASSEPSGDCTSRLISALLQSKTVAI